MTAPEYRYEVDGGGFIFVHSDGDWCPAGRVRIDGVSETTALGPLERSERDLLRVCAAVLDADRLSPRRPFNARRGERALSWQRTLHLRVAVEDPERWTAAADGLIQLLAFMTDDSWALTFNSAPRPLLQQIVPHTGLEQPTEIALFSGGLDSTAGLYIRGASTNARILAVSACGNDVRGRAQDAALDGLRRFGIEAKGLKFVHQLRAARRTRNRMESSQRSRGLVFLSMGAVTASRLSLPQFSIYETGIGCMNLPMSCAQVGAQGTRAMHPRTLDLFWHLLPLVLDRPTRPILPFFLATKGELCGMAGTAMDVLARVTMSCDEGEGHKARALDHCGVCTSCLFRRIAIRSSGQPDPTVYRDREMRRHGRYEQLVFESHARELLLASVFKDLCAIDPNSRFGLSAPMDVFMHQSDLELEIIRLYHRYASEVLTFLETARPPLAPASPARRKENERDLFAATG